MKTKHALIEEDMVGTFDEVSATIDNSSEDFIIKLVSENLYKNKIGSMIRELVSNAWDANTENNSNKPVKVKFEIFDDNRGELSIQDYGKGMNKSFMQGEYMKLFHSTKRDTNEMIGLFGIGSKSPLAYSDHFTITSTTKEDDIYMERVWLITKGSPKFKLSLLEESESETTESGVKITVPIEYRDYDRVSASIIEQLAYFDNVFVEDENDTYFNEYKIIETPHFKYKTSNHPYDEMHIVFGKVTYPISWKTINMKSIALPIALKFDIGDLSVTPSREDIEYDSDTIDLILQKIENAKNWIKDQWYKQKSTNDVLNACTMLRHNTDVLKLGDYSLTLDGYYRAKNDLNIKLFDTVVHAGLITEIVNSFYSVKKVNRANVAAANSDAVLPNNKSVYTTDKPRNRLLNYYYRRESSFIFKSKTKVSSKRRYLTYKYVKEALRFDDIKESIFFCRRVVKSLKKDIKPYGHIFDENRYKAAEEVFNKLNKIEEVKTDYIKVKQFFSNDSYCGNLVEAEKGDYISGSFSSNHRSLYYRKHSTFFIYRKYKDVVKPEFKKLLYTIHSRARAKVMFVSLSTRSIQRLKKKLGEHRVIYYKDALTAPPLKRTLQYYKLYLELYSKDYRAGNLNLKPLSICVKDVTSKIRKYSYKLHNLYSTGVDLEPTGLYYVWNTCIDQLGLRHEPNSKDREKAKSYLKLFKKVKYDYSTQLYRKYYIKISKSLTKVIRFTEVLRSINLHSRKALSLNERKSIARVLKVPYINKSSKSRA